MPQAVGQRLEFGWFMLTGAVPGKTEVSIIKDEALAVLPVVDELFDSIWVPDHFYGFTDPKEAFIECWTTMAWLAGHYPHLKVGPIVMGVGYRNPALLAKMAATLQDLSAGRFIMGIGAGWRGEEYKAYGYPFPSATQRIAELEEAVQIFRLMWTEEAPTFRGKYFQIEKAYCEPRPDPPIPIMIGGGGEKLMLPLIGRLADIWDRYHGGTIDNINLDDYKRKLDIVRESASNAGRDPSSIRLSYTIENETLPKSSAESEKWFEALRPLVGLGVRQIIAGFGPVTDPEGVRRFASEVIEPLRAG